MDDTAVNIVVAKSFEYIISVLVALLLVGREESPFKTHPIQMWAFVVAIIIYSLAFQLSNAVVAIISGSLSTVLLVSIFLPKPIRSIFNDIHNACLRLDPQTIMEDFISKFSVVWTWLTRSSSSEQEQEHEQPRP